MALCSSSCKKAIPWAITTTIFTDYIGFIDAFKNLLIFGHFSVIFRAKKAKHRNNWHIAKVTFGYTIKNSQTLQDSWTKARLYTHKKATFSGATYVNIFVSVLSHRIWIYNMLKFSCHKCSAVHPQGFSSDCTYDMIQITARCVGRVNTWLRKGI